MNDINSALGVSDSHPQMQNEQISPTPKSAIGTAFNVLGVLNGIVACFSLLLPLALGNSNEKIQSLIVMASCLSGMFVCLAISAALHYLCGIFHRLQNLQITQRAISGDK
jgi:hypothetical protein